MLKFSNTSWHRESLPQCHEMKLRFIRHCLSFIIALGLVMIFGMAFYASEIFYNWNKFIQRAVVTFSTETNLELNDTTQRSADTKPFIYLTGTEQCLPANLASSDQIGDPRTCGCDVMVLSFRTKCETPQGNLSHVSYLFDPNTGWASARNVLFFAVMKRRPGYHYYIFLNDDTVLKYNQYTPANMRELSPFRVVEKWLLDYEPAVGVLDYTRHNGARVVLERRKRRCGINKKSLVLPTVFFDAIFNAFHHKAVEHLLPYPTQYEHHNWYCINIQTVTQVEVKFPGQALLFAPVTAVNPVHRHYSRNKTNVSKIWREYVKGIIQEAPPKLREHAVFKKLSKYQEKLLGYLNDISRTSCLNVIRHQPIIPYNHLQDEV